MGVTKEQLGTGEYPAIKAGDVNSTLPKRFYKCSSFVDPSILKKIKYFYTNDILISGLGSEKTIGKSCAYLGEVPGILGECVISLSHKQNPKYLSYALSLDSSRKQFQYTSTTSTLKRLHTSQIKKIKIPLPPLEIQNKIVEFLDKLTELKNELELELEKRKKQYEYYKNLIFDRGIGELNWEFKTLENIATEIYKGNDVMKSQLGTGNHPAITAGHINGKGKIWIDKPVCFIDPNLISRKKYCNYSDVLITNIGNLPTVGNVATYLCKETCLAGENVYVVKHNQNPKYLSYALSSEKVRQQIEESVYQGIVYVLSKKNIQELKIPIPSLEEQEKVVEFLDKLYTITNDINSGIPLLIKKIQQQYDFYKETLISPE